MNTNPSQPATRPPMERILFIFSKLRAGDYFDCAALQRTFEISRRTVLRDIEFLRDRLHAPLEYDRGHRGYCLTGDFNLIPPVDLRHEDVFTLHFIRQSLAPSMKKSFDRILTLLMGAQAWKKIDETGDISQTASNFRAGGSRNANR